MVGTLLSRNIHIPFGHGQIYPNQYIMLTGGPGTRKGTAIKIGKALLKMLDYNTFSPNKAAKETLWHIMSRQHELEEGEDMADLVYDDPVSAMYIAQDEFIDFIGIGNDELLTNLTNLWDNLDEFFNPKMTKEDTFISKPTINILSGATPGGIAEAFGGLAMSGGFFSRMLFIYGGYNGVKIPWPDNRSMGLEQELLDRLRAVEGLYGALEIKPSVKELLGDIYVGFPGMQDRRFSYYTQRRFTHLLKLVMTLTAMRDSLEVIEEDAILANTILHLAEMRMPYALGEFGKGKNAEIANDLLDILKEASLPMTSKQLWKHLRVDLNKTSDLNSLLQNLLSADKIQKAKLPTGEIGFLVRMESESRWEPKHIDYSMMLDEEHPEAVQLDEQPNKI